MKKMKPIKSKRQQDIIYNFFDVFIESNIMTNAENLQYAKQVAKTILSQLGGNRFITMTGAKVSFLLDEKEQPVLKCVLPSNMKIKNNINVVKITYNIGLDVYQYSFINTKRIEANQVIKQIDTVYVDDLIPFFEEETGLYTKL